MNYYRVQNITELKELLKKNDRAYTILAGGTDLLIEARQKPLKQDEYVLDISAIAELSTIENSGDMLVVGSAVTHEQLANDKQIKEFAPLLADACRQVGSLQIRNRGTIGGNICNASPCADTVPPLMVLNAEIELTGPNGTRSVQIADFFEKPYHPRIQKNEVVLYIRFNKLGAGLNSSFYKLGRRNALAISRINMAVVMGLSGDGKIEEARIAPGSVFPAWNRVQVAEDFLIGKQAGAENFLGAGKIVADKMIGISGRRWSTPYKEPVVTALVKRALMQAVNLSED